MIYNGGRGALLAGLIMWVPAGLSYLFATIWLAAEWLREPERRASAFRRAARR